MSSCSITALLRAYFFWIDLRAEVVRSDAQRGSEAQYQGPCRVGLAQFQATHCVTVNTAQPSQLFL